MCDTAKSPLTMSGSGKNFFIMIFFHVLMDWV